MVLTLPLLFIWVRQGQNFIEFVINSTEKSYEAMILIPLFKSSTPPLTTLFETLKNLRNQISNLSHSNNAFQCSSRSQAEFNSKTGSKPYTAPNGLLSSFQLLGDQDNISPNKSLDIQFIESDSRCWIEHEPEHLQTGCLKGIPKLGLK